MTPDPVNVYGQRTSEPISASGCARSAALDPHDRPYIALNRLAVMSEAGPVDKATGGVGGRLTLWAGAAAVTSNNTDHGLTQGRGALGRRSPEHQRAVAHSGEHPLPGGGIGALMAGDVHRAVSTRSRGRHAGRAGRIRACPVDHET
jgi:hypothetical protein